MNKYTFLNLKSLKNIAKELNKDERFSSKKIIIAKYNKNNKKKLINDIQKKLNSKKYINFQELKGGSVFYKEIKNIMKPKSPGDKEWLSTIDIRNVMNKYQKIYKDFLFLGPVPIDFEKIYDEITNMNIKSLCNNKKQVGIVFNTDTSSGPGEHWLSLFLNMKDKTICFFDSVGDRPPKQIKKLINNIIVKSKNLGCPLKLIINKHQFQYDDYSCGIYSCFFLISRLEGNSCEKIFNKKMACDVKKCSKVSDNLMNEKRKEYFN